MKVHGLAWVCICLVLFPISVFSQEDTSDSDKKTSTILSAGERRTKLTLQGGYYLSNQSYNEVRAGENISVDFSYMLNGNWSIGQHMNFGRNRYYDNTRSNFPSYNRQDDSTNADIFLIQVGFNLGYTYPLSRFITVSAFSGISTYSETIVYPVLGNAVFGETISAGYVQEIRTLFTMPLIFSLQYLPTDYLEIGLRGGFYVSAEEESLLGAHIGPQFILKF
jgi:hypothetical protein